MLCKRQGTTGLIAYGTGNARKNSTDTCRNTPSIFMYSLWTLSHNICYTRPQLVSMILAAVLVVPVTPDTCQKSHTHINKVCYDQKNLEVCQYGGQEHWVGENLGKGGIRLGLSCPRGEQWLCFTKVGHWDIPDGGGVQDMVQEEIVKNVTRHLIEQG
uniref:Uncharacterized protein n=1 Tax=Strigops habroptila TaxID=2489341 RepID=A0A672TGS4_STRHB